ncbi:MAG: hypothetical protein QE271_04905 [Bacteriovoracaceae bacterium]|nr:hypothetical protein [Bacteriovoracaceae bacterium]
MNKSIVFLCMMFFTSCLKKIEGKNFNQVFHHQPEELKELENKCSLLNKEGNIQDLTKQLTKSIKLLDSLTDEDVILGNMERIKKESFKIENLVKSIETVASSEYTSKKYEQLIMWEIDPKAVKEEVERIALAREMEATKWKLKQQNILKAYKNGIEVDTNCCKYEGWSSRFMISYRSTDTALGICQLQDTIFIIIELVYEGENLKSVSEKKSEDDSGIIRLKYGLFVKNQTDFSIPNIM